MTFSSEAHGKVAVDWWQAANPATGPLGTGAQWVGVTFSLLVAGRIAGIRFYVATGNDAAQRCSLFDFPVTTEHRCVWARERVSKAAAGWQQVWFRPWLRVTLDPYQYRAAVLFPAGGFFRNNAVLGGPIVHNNIQFANSFQSTSLIPELAAITTNTNANGIDILFYPD